MGEMQIKPELEDKAKEVLEQMGTRKGVLLYTGPTLSAGLSAANNPSVFLQNKPENVLRQLPDPTWHLASDTVMSDGITPVIRPVSNRNTPFRSKILTQLLSLHIKTRKSMLANKPVEVVSFIGRSVTVSCSNATSIELVLRDLVANAVRDNH